MEEKAINHLRKHRIHQKVSYDDWKIILEAIAIAKKPKGGLF